MCIWRGNNLEEESIVCLSEVEMNTSRVTVLRVGVSPLPIKGSKNWCIMLFAFVLVEKH